MADGFIATESTRQSCKTCLLITKSRLWQSATSGNLKNYFIKTIVRYFSVCIHTISTV